MMTIKDMYNKCSDISLFCSIYLCQYKCTLLTKYATIHWKCQSSSYKSTKRCVQAVKLNSMKEICVFIWILKEVLCRFLLRTYLVLVMHVYCVANCGHTTASLLVLHPCNTTFVIKIIFRSLESLIQIVSYFSFLSLSLSLSLSFKTPHA